MQFESFDSFCIRVSYRDARTQFAASYYSWHSYLFSFKKVSPLKEHISWRMNLRNFSHTTEGLHESTLIPPKVCDPPSPEKLEGHRIRLLGESRLSKMTPLLTSAEVIKKLFQYFATSILKITLFLVFALSPLFFSRAQNEAILGLIPERETRWKWKWLKLYENWKNCIFYFWGIEWAISNKT